MNPVDAFIKEAGWWDAFKKGVSAGQKTTAEGLAHNIGQALPTAAAAAGFAAVGYGASKGINAIREALNKPRGYRMMIQTNPSLAKEDAGQVQMVYNSLHTLAPDLAGDPLIAGSFVRRTLDMTTDKGPIIDINTVKTLAQSQKALEGPDRPISQKFMP